MGRGSSALPLHSTELAAPACPPNWLGFDGFFVGFLGLLLLLPDFLRRLEGQVLMQADAVVPMLEFIEQALQLRGALNLDLIELLLERAKQSLDSSVLPRAVKINALMMNACLLERGFPFWADEAFYLEQVTCIVGVIIHAVDGLLALAGCRRPNWLAQLLCHGCAASLERYGKD